MDPLSAFGLATNILAFVEFSCKLVADARAIYKSAEGASDNNRTLETIATQITAKNSQLVSSPTYPKELQVLCDECDKVANELLAAIKKLRAKGRNNRWGCFKVALRETWGQGKIESLDKRLQQLQKQLTIQMQFLLLDKQSSVSQEITRMGQVDQKLDMETSRRLAALETNILQILSALKSHPETFAEQSETLTTTAGNYSTEVKSTNWNQRFIQSLYYPQFQSRNDAISTAHAETFKWILTDTSAKQQTPSRFIEWLRSKNGTFFIQGKAGSGKSTLMKFLWHHHATREHLQAWSGESKLLLASYFFWSAGDELQKSEEGLIRALLFEIFRVCPDLISIIRTGQETKSVIDRHPQEVEWTRTTLLKVFDIVLQQRFEAKLCFFIDGLDEYKGNTQSLVSLVQKLASYPGTKVCVSSRPWAEFRHAFGEGANANWHIKLEDLTKNDIHRYVNDKLNADAQFSKLRENYAGYSDIAEQVMSRARGVFLWVMLVVRSLLQGATYDDSLADMHRRLGAIPDDLDEFFKQMLKDIPRLYRSQSAMTFKIALAAKKPLPLVFHGYADEIHQDPGSAIAAPTKQMEDAALQGMIKQIPNRLDARCKGLLEIVKCRDSPNAYYAYEVDFLHRTVRDYLDESQETTGILDNDLKDDFDASILLCHASLANLKRAWPGPNQIESEHDPDGSVTLLYAVMYYAKQLQDRYGHTRLIEDVLNEAKKVWSALDSQSGAVQFDGTAIQAGLESYYIQQLSSSTGKKQYLAERATQLLAYALFDQRRTSFGSQLTPSIINSLLSHGANPNHCPDRSTTMFTLWGQFVANRCDTGDVEEDNEEVIFAILGDLISHGADIGFQFGDSHTAEQAIGRRSSKRANLMLGRAPGLSTVRNGFRRQLQQWKRHVLGRR
ncbi:hypothetical protein PG996_015435 [Apiospora saccharicola]|uniref:NACHT domain-containing protein n=1 Tax=Apiospora saccharicola TaxID=335842 RepID=A0ABR1TL37_9PEZI